MGNVAKARELREERFSCGLCVMCGKAEHEPGKQKCKICNDRMKNYPVQRSDSSLVQRQAYSRAYTKELYDRRREANLCIQCGKNPPEYTDRCDKCYDRYKVLQKQSRVKLKEAAFKAYGGYTCACCNEAKAPCFLQLDHVNGDGCSHLGASGKRLKGDSLYRWLQKNNYPPEFQVLCADCNFAKGNEVECPHKEQTRSMLAKLSMLPLTY